MSKIKIGYKYIPDFELKIPYPYVSDLEDLKKVMIYMCIYLLLPILLLLGLYYVTGIYLIDYLDKFKGHDDPLLFLLVSPAIALSLSLPFYFTRKSIYHAWLKWTGICLLLLVLLVVTYKPSFMFDGAQFTFLAAVYVGGSLSILTFNGVLKLLEHFKLKTPPVEAVPSELLNTEIGTSTDPQPQHR